MIGGKTQEQNSSRNSNDWKGLKKLN